MDCNCGMEYGMEYGIWNALWNWQCHFYSKYLYSYFLTSLKLMASSALYWVAFMEPPQSCSGQRSLACLINFNWRIPYIAAKKKTFERSRSDRVEEETKHSVKWPRLLYTKFHGLFHVFQSSDFRDTHLPSSRLSMQCMGKPWILGPLSLHLLAFQVP